MEPIAKAHEVSVAQIALAWLLQKTAVMSVIVGAKTIEQLDDNLAAVKVTLSGEEITALDKVSALKAEYPGWMLERQAAPRMPTPVA
jgi:aryl-alcohol dehydrogenase-like predicted oxidoreductase